MGANSVRLPGLLAGPKKPRGFPRTGLMTNRLKGD
jgi:hypothetical protein